MKILQNIQWSLFSCFAAFLALMLMAAIPTAHASESVHGSEFVFAITAGDVDEGESETLFWINTVEAWDRKRLTDSYTPDERAFLKDILKEAGLEEVQESIFTPSASTRRAILHASMVLQENGIERNMEFEEWVKESF